jgi:ornithine decarboxylase
MAGTICVVTPRLVLDLGLVCDRYRVVTAALPGARVLYAVKANPHPDVLTTLATLGSGFDVAGPAEVQLALAAGAPPAALSYGNPIRKASEAAAVAGRGVREFVTDSPEDLAMLADAAPGATVLVRVDVDDAGSATPFGGKFGCSTATAAALLRRGAGLGLVPGGVSFHAGSQQVDPAAWVRGIAAAAQVWPDTPLINLGGGLPVPYDRPVPPPAEYAAAVDAALREHFPGRRPALAVEPGRFLVAEAGVLHAEVVRVSRRDDGHRWVYLDVGRYGGLAETENEAIRYRITGPRDGGPTGPAVLATYFTAASSCRWICAQATS